MDHDVNDVLAKTGLSVPRLAEKLKVNTSTPYQWQKKQNGEIPERYNAKIDKLLKQAEEEGPLVNKDVKKRKKKLLEVEEIIEKKKEEPVVVAIVGTAAEVNKVLSNLKLTKD